MDDIQAPKVLKALLIAQTVTTVKVVLVGLNVVCLELSEHCVEG